MANIDLGNLTRYDGKVKEYAEDKYLSKNTANWQMTEKAGAVTCYPVPDTDLEPIVDFSFKEVPPVSGDKGLTNPSIITGVESVKVMRYGKNLCPLNSTVSTIYGVTFTPQENGGYKISGTTDNTNTVRYYLTTGPSFLLKAGQTYTVSLRSTSQNANILMQGFNANNEYIISVLAGQTITITISNQDEYLYLPIVIFKTAGVVDTVVYPQIELSSVGSEFEKPVFTDYTINLNNTYYGGSVNLATGEMTVTHWGHVFDGTESVYQFDAFTNNGRCIFFRNVVQAKNSISQTCTHLSFLESFLSDTTHFYVNYGGSNTGVVMYAPYLTLSDFKSWLAEQYALGTPVTVACELNTPYTVQLTSMQIKSISALDKNTPRLNTLYTNADSIQVGYQKHPARTAYELENAILALGGGE